jgi:hypothetical protein
MPGVAAQPDHHTHTAVRTKPQHAGPVGLARAKGDKPPASRRSEARAAEARAANIAARTRTTIAINATVGQPLRGIRGDSWYEELRRRAKVDAARACYYSLANAHPKTGRKAIVATLTYTLRGEGSLGWDRLHERVGEVWKRAESAALFHDWKAGDCVIWDNRKHTRDQPLLVIIGIFLVAR